MAGHAGIDLHAAVAAGSCAHVAKLLAQGADIEDTHGYCPPLHVACQEGHVAVVEQLLAHGADREAVDRLQRRPLHWACAQGHPAVVELLARHHADIEAADMEGCRPLHLAMYHNADARVLEQLLGCGVDITAVDGSDASALHLAAAAGNVAAVERLLAAGLDIEQRDLQGHTPLMAAVWAAADVPTIREPRLTPAVAALLAHGAQPDVRNVLDNTALHMACSRGCAALAGALLAGGAAVCALNERHETPLHRACRCASWVQCGAQLDSAYCMPMSRQPVGWLSPCLTLPAHTCGCSLGYILHNQPETVTALLEAGADVHARNQQGLTPLAVACFGPRPDYQYDEERADEVVMAVAAALLDAGALVADVAGDIGSLPLPLHVMLAGHAHQELAAAVEAQREAQQELQCAREQLATLGSLQQLGVEAAGAMAELAAEQRRLEAVQQRLAAERQQLAAEQQELGPAQQGQPSEAEQVGYSCELACLVLCRRTACWRLSCDAGVVSPWLAGCVSVELCASNAHALTATPLLLVHRRDRLQAWRRPSGSGSGTAAAPKMLARQASTLSTPCLLLAPLHHPCNLQLC